MLRLRSTTRAENLAEKNQEVAAQLNTLIEGIPQLVWRAVDEGQFTWVSPQWTAFTGLSEDDSRGQGWLQALCPGERERTLAVWRGAAETGRFEIEHRLRHAGDDRARWFQTRAKAVRNRDGAIVEWLGTSTDIDDLRQLQEEQKVLVAELQHRTRNLLAVVGSIARQTMARTGPTEAFQVAFTDRLSALSRVQALLSRSGDEPIGIRDVVEMELKALGIEPSGGRVELEGPEVPLRKSVVQTMALAIHELATNARKYGALADGEGASPSGGRPGRTRTGNGVSISSGSREAWMSRWKSRARCRSPPATAGS